MSLLARAAAAIWDNMPLPLQHAVFNHAPQLAWRLDALAAQVDAWRRT